VETAQVIERPPIDGEALWSANPMVRHGHYLDNFGETWQARFEKNA
jgi:hypothetical protein